MDDNRKKEGESTMSQEIKKYDDVDRDIFQYRVMSEQTKKSYLKAAEYYYDYLKKTGKDEGIDSVKSFLEKVKEEKAPATFNLRMQGLKHYLMEKYKDDMRLLSGITRLFENFRKTRVEKAVLKENYLTKEQVIDVADKVSQRLSLIVKALFWSGCRISELINMKVDDVKVNDEAAIRVRSGKGDKERTVYLPSELYEEIQVVFSGTEYLFETGSHKKYNSNNIYNELKRQSKKAGYDISPHTLRHSNAMYLKDVKRLSAEKIAEALGHSRVSTTLDTYFHSTPAEGQKIVSKNSN